MLKRFTCLALAGIVVLISGQARAEVGDPLRWHGWLGYSGISGDASDIVKDGWSAGFGVLYTPAKGFLQFRGDLGFDWWDIKTGNIPTGEVRIDDGDAGAWSLRGGVQAGTKREGFNFYGGVGIGGYYLQAELEQTALVSGIYCDPWWGWCYPITTVGDVIVADDSTTKFGYYAMVGGAFQAGPGEVFLEASYHWVQTKSTFEYIPIVLGYRW